MKQRGTLIAGLIGGAAGMYLFDPSRGRRRRARLRDRATHLAHEAREGVRRTTRDARQRARGVAAEVRAHRREDHAPDGVVVERVRAQLGRLVSHPRAIDVNARGGRVTLSGPVLAHEVPVLIEGVSRVRGVREVNDRLEGHDAAERHPALQGGVPRRGPRPAVLQTRWSPSLRAGAAVAGGALLALGLRRPGRFVNPLALAGAALLVRAMPMRGEANAGGRRGVRVTKTVHLDAPLQQVFDFWTRFENFPRFMRHLVEVRDLGGGRSHWVARGPGGLPVSWNARIVAIERNRAIAWRSEPGSRVWNAGQVRFEPFAAGGTRVTVQFVYRPPGGALGHAVARLFGADPRHELDEDLARLGSLLEVGRTTVEGETVERADLTAARSVPEHAGMP